MICREGTDAMKGLIRRWQTDQTTTPAYGLSGTAQSCGNGLPPPMVDVVGTFPGPLGQPLVLVRDTTLGREASLEEIVLGHLAAARTRAGVRC